MTLKSLTALNAVLTEVRGFARLAVRLAVGKESASLVVNEFNWRGFNPQPEPPPLEF